MLDEQIENILPEPIELYNAVKISESNVSIYRDNKKCIDCGLCKTICENREGILDICDGKACVNCGQCMQVCPVGAIKVKNDVEKFLLAKDKGLICIAYVAPAARVSIAESFNMNHGEFVQGKVISALKKLGFNYVLDVACAADVTIVEEAAEFVRRLKNGGKLPMFSSCCPSWVKYAEMFYPELIGNLSTCKSPISMQGALVNDYFILKKGVDNKNIFTVAITPCTSKKYEVKREELPGTDIVLTIKELVSLIKDRNIDFKNLEDANFDSFFSEGSGSGIIFGSSGGVTEALIRTVHKILTGKNLIQEDLTITKARGMQNVKEISLCLNGQRLNFAIVHQMSSAKPILDKVKDGTSKYHFIEIMNCLGGCIGGGGLPKIDNTKELKIKKARMSSLYEKDKIKDIRESHKNKDVVKLYNEYLNNPLSLKSEELLHTYYKDRSNILDKED